MSDFDIFRSFWHIGGNLNTILYGLELVLYYHTLKFSLDGRTRRKRANANTASDDAKCWLTLSLSTTLFFLITVYLFTQSSFGEVTWIIDVNVMGYPGGGSGQCAAEHTAVWYRATGSAVSVVMTWMSGAYFIHRVWAVWGGRRDVIVVPCVLYLGTLLLGIPMCFYAGRLGGPGFFVGTVAPRIAMAYSAVAIALNVICTLLISSRILYVSRGCSPFLNGGIPDDLSTSRNTRGSGIFWYRIAALMAVDSMLPHTLFGVSYLIALRLASPVYILFISLYVMFACLSPQMTMLRVAMGCEWRDERELAAGLLPS